MLYLIAKRVLKWDDISINLHFIFQEGLRFSKLSWMENVVVSKELNYASRHVHSFIIQSVI